MGKIRVEKKARVHQHAAPAGMDTLTDLEAIAVPKITATAFAQEPQDLQSEDTTTPTSAAAVALKKGDRRKLRRDRFLAKLESSFKAGHKKSKKGDTAPTSLQLDALAVNIPNPFEKKAATAVARPANPTTHKARSKMLLQEAVHLQHVLAHPKFRSNPLATITEHLRNTFQPSQ
eukprot:m.77511 g.77511  ORF g.77511 m.77511 type:complete len:175 (-) comp50508_c0_seq1:32-556(-)